MKEGEQGVKEGEQGVKEGGQGVKEGEQWRVKGRWQRCGGGMKREWQGEGIGWGVRGGCRSKIHLHLDRKSDS